MNSPAQKPTKPNKNYDNNYYNNGDRKPIAVIKYGIIWSFHQFNGDYKVIQLPVF